MTKTRERRTTRTIEEWEAAGSGKADRLAARMAQRRGRRLRRPGETGPYPSVLVSPCFYEIFCVIHRAFIKRIAGPFYVPSTLDFRETKGDEEGQLGRND